MVTILTSTSDSPLDVRRMPSTDTGDLSETLVCLSRQLLRSPSAGDTGETVTLGDSDDINHLILLKDGADLDWLLEKTVTEGNLISDATTVNLDLHQVGLLLLKWRLADLGVGDNTDDSAVLLDTLKLTSDRRAGVLRVLLGVLGEGLLLALVPVLVESALDLIGKMLSPDSGKRTKSTGGFDITN